MKVLRIGARSARVPPPLAGRGREAACSKLRRCGGALPNPPPAKVALTPVLSGHAGEGARNLLAWKRAEAVSDTPRTSNSNAWDTLARADVLSGLLFIAVAAFGLWVSRDYPVGTALRMGTGYVPRLLCWMLLGLGAIVLVQGLREQARRRCGRRRWRLRAVLAVSLRASSRLR